MAKTKRTKDKERRTKHYTHRVANIRTTDRTRNEHDIHYNKDAVEKRTKGQTTIHNILHRKLKIE